MYMFRDRLEARQLNPNKANVLFAQLLGTRDFISYALGQFVSDSLLFRTAVAFTTMLVTSIQRILTKGSIAILSPIVTFPLPLAAANGLVRP